MTEKSINMLQTTDEYVIWRTYPKYPLIEANQFGEVRTKDRYVRGVNGSKRLIKGRILITPKTLKLMAKFTKKTYKNARK